MQQLKESPGRGSLNLDSGIGGFHGFVLANLGHMQEMCREQILGDQELIRDIEAGREAPDEEVRDRLRFTRGIVEWLGMDSIPFSDGAVVV